MFCRRAEVKDCYTKEDYVLLMQHTFRQSRGKPQRRLDRSNFIDRLQHEVGEPPATPVHSGTLPYSETLVGTPLPSQ